MLVKRVRNELAGSRLVGSVLILAALLAGSSGLMAMPDQEEPPREIYINTPGLMFDESRFRMDPGEQVKITLENIDEMSHNMVITTPGSREKVVALALGMIDDPKSDFVPESDLVLAYIPMLQPGEK